MYDVAFNEKRKKKVFNISANIVLTSTVGFFVGGFFSLFVFFIIKLRKVCFHLLYQGAKQCSLLDYPHECSGQEVNSHTPKEGQQGTVSSKTLSVQVLGCV